MAVTVHCSAPGCPEEADAVESLLVADLHFKVSQPHCHSAICLPQLITFWA